MRISDDNVYQLKQIADIKTVVEHYIPLQKSSSTQYKSNCPFHHEKTPSFLVNVEKQYYYCFGCGAKGDVFDFIKNYTNVSFRDAATVLAEMLGVTLNTSSFSNFGQIMAQEYVERQVPMAKKLAFAGKRELRTGYDFDRQPMILSHRQIEFPPYYLPLGDSRIAAINHYVTKRNFNLEVLREKGYGGCGIGRYQQRLVIPCYMDGVLAFWQARDITDKDQIKYLNPSRSIVSASICIYNFESAIKYPMPLIMEGAFDVERTGSDAMGMYGCRVTKEQARMLQIKKVKHVCICFDPDVWQKKNTRNPNADLPIVSAVRTLMECGISVDIAILDGDDPDKLGEEKTRAYVANRVHVESLDMLRELTLSVERRQAELASQ